MSTISNSLRALNSWQIAILTILPIAILAIIFGSYVLLGDDNDLNLAENQQLIPVQLGDLVKDVSINGSLIYSTRETLKFSSKGTVGELLVESGQQVSSGETLAVLDSSTVASLGKAVAQAEVRLQDAKDALDSAQNTYTPLELSQLELKVAKSRLNLNQAKDDLSTLKNPPASSILKADAAVAVATLSVQQAENTLSELINPSTLAIAIVTNKVTTAQFGVDEAQTLLDKLKSSPTAEDILDAQGAVDKIQTAIDEAILDWELNSNQLEKVLSDAQATEKTTKLTYQSTISKWLGIDLTESDLQTEIDDLLVKYEVDLDALFDASRRFEDTVSGSYWSSGMPADDPSTAWNEQILYLWLNLWPGRIVATCEDLIFPASEKKERQSSLIEGVCVQKEIEDAYNIYVYRREQSDEASHKFERQKVVHEDFLSSRQRDLDSAKETKNLVIDGPEPINIQVQTDKLHLAKESLKSAQDDLFKLMNPDPLEVDAKSKLLAVAQDDLAESKYNLSKLLGEPDLEDMTVQEQTTSVAQATLDEATQELKELKSGVDPLKIALLEAELSLAKSELTTALESLAGATIKAPISGIIASISVEVGQQVQTNTPILEIVDPTTVEVDGTVDEIDVLFISVGAQASVTMDALPGQNLSGTVSDIAISAASQQGVVSYSINIRVEVPDGTQLPEGLSAVASVIISEDRNVLLVPIDALQGTFQEPILQIMTINGMSERPVILGNSDDFWIVVDSGVQENESVVMQVRDASTQGFGGFSAFRRSSGGFGGFGGGRPGNQGGGGSRSR